MNLPEIEICLLLEERDVDPVQGTMISAHGSSVNVIPCPVSRGTHISAAEPSQLLKFYFYSPETPPELIHTYCYHDESNWTTFRPDLSVLSWTDQPFIAPADGFIRVAVSGGGKRFLSEVIRAEFPALPEAPVPVWMDKQLSELCCRVSALRRPGDLTMFVLTDTHFAAGGIWKDTLRSLQLAAEKISPDAVTHLGDFTDGILPGAQTSLLVQWMQRGLEALCGKLYCCVGNHDVNYYKSNPDRFTRDQCAALYLRRKTPWYYVDDRQRQLRMIFLDSFDPKEKIRYGFPKEEVEWVRRILDTVPKGWKVLFFSHVPPAAEIHVWSKTIRNGETMLKTAERFHKRRGGPVMGWIHGHNHADLVYRGRKIPIVGIGNSKLEDFRDHKPEGSKTWDRVRGTESQELWDVLLIHPDDGSMDFLRFGAGEDRHTEMIKPL